MPGDPVASLVKGYLIERVRSLSDADPELFARAFELYDTGWLPAEHVMVPGLQVDRVVVPPGTVGP